MFLVVIRFRPMLIIAGGAVRGNLMPVSYAGARSTCSRAAILDTVWAGSCQGSEGSLALICTARLLTVLGDVQVAAHAGICYGVSQGDLWFKPRGSAEIR
ncbi:hypothetical protein VPH35_066293 [Triticum aestivum]